MKQLKKRVCVLLSTFAARNFDFFINFHLNFNNMRKTYQMILALALLMLGVTNAMGQKIYRAELDKSMFKAWDSNLPGANVVANPENEPKENHAFACAFDLYKTVEQGGMIYGSGNVYYLWYADLTGTKKMYVKGTPGMKIRLMLNREAPADGVGDADGGNYVEIVKDIPESGEVVFDFTAEEKLAQYIHLNAIKVPYGSSSGVVTAIDIEGTVKPVTGILSMINNGDAEGDDLSSFPVSWNGPNNGDTAPDSPSIVEGLGVNGSRCFKVTSYPEPTETWHTQFYILADEVMPQGTKWKLSMWIKADNDCKIATSSQGAPRQYKAGDFVPAFQVSNEWKQFEWSGEIGVSDFQSIAFDLNNGEDGAGNGNCNFYFDNIQFGVDLGGSNPMSDVTLSHGGDVVCIDLANNTNLKDLVNTKGIEISGYDENGDPIKTKTLVFDNSCATVTWNGKTCNITSVEGREDGNLYVFLDDTDGEGSSDFDDEAAVVTVAFVNPADNNHHLTFTTGKWQGQDVPNFDGLICIYNEDLGSGKLSSYLWGPPELEKADPENGSFNLDPKMKDFKITFNQRINAETVVAKLGNEPLTVSSNEGKTITLTRTGSGDLNGAINLVISAAVGEKGDDYALQDPITLRLNFGPLVIDPNDQPEELIPASYCESTAAGYIPEGFLAHFADADRVAGTGYGSGPCMKTYNAGGDFTRALYFREGYVMYGTLEGYSLSLKAGRKYDIQFNSMKWKSNGTAIKFEILNEADEVVYTEMVTPNPDINGAQNVVVSGSTLTTVAFTPEADGNYKLKWTASDADGNQAYSEVMLAKVQVTYTPSTPGLAETLAITAALDKAKATLEANSDSRYDGPAYTALDNVIKEYDGVTFTAPSVCATAVEELDAASQAMTDHHNLCADYDPLPQAGQDILDKFAGTKFATTEIYATLTTVVNKYGEVKVVKETDPETGEEKDVKKVEIVVLKDDEALKAASTELKNAIAMAVGHADVARSGKGMFTEGESKCNNSPTSTGYAVLVDRIRSGAETLKTLGVPATDDLIIAANNALSDDDALAEKIQNRIKKELYGQLKNVDNTLFQPTIDEATEESVTPTYDMSVFVKNANIYNLNVTATYSQENVPGWEVTDCRGFSTGWDPAVGTAQIPADAMFSNWSGAFTVSQTVENLPAGVYSLRCAYGERNDEASAEGSYFFVSTSANEAEPLTKPCPVIGQSIPSLNIEIPDVVITDGKLTLGVQAGGSSHVFFDKVQVVLTAPATGFDYSAAYETEAAGIETLEGTPAAKVRGIQLFDLNGRRLSKAQKGITIVKKVMSDGSIQTEKVVVK